MGSDRQVAPNAAAGIMRDIRGRYGKVRKTLPLGLISGRRSCPRLRPLWSPGDLLLRLLVPRSRCGRGDAMWAHLHPWKTRVLVTVLLVIYFTVVASQAAHASGCS